MQFRYRTIRLAHYTREICVLPALFVATRFHGSHCLQFNIVWLRRSYVFTFIGKRYMEQDAAEYKRAKIAMKADLDYITANYNKMLEIQSN